MNTIERPTPSGDLPRSSATIHTVVARRRFPRRVAIVIGTGIALAILVVALIVAHARSLPRVSYQTTPVVQQDLIQSVTATGTVNPQNTIAVGTQVSGTISALNVDFNSHVTRGQVLATLDPTALQAALDQAQAALAQAQDEARAAGASAAGAIAGAGSAVATQRAAEASASAAKATAGLNAAAIAAAQAGIAKLQSALDVAQQTVARDGSLLAQGYIAQSQLDTDRSNLVAAQSALQSAKIAVQQAQFAASASRSTAAASNAQTTAAAFATSSAQAQAAAQGATAAASADAIKIAAAQVQTAQTNLAHTIITSPVDGTVVAREVSVGQTVAASLQTPTLFSIAQDLRKMEVDLSVGEPDIGNVRAGETVTFTVLAYPNRTFVGKVSQVRINPTITTNVVTYTTVVLVDNSDGKLLPGMTANASIQTAKAANAIVVPVAALAYSGTRPVNGTRRARTGSTTAATDAVAGPRMPANASPWGKTSGSAATPVAAGGTGRVFVRRDGKLVRVPVKITLVNATLAAVVPLEGARLGTADAVITGDSTSVPVGAGPANRAASNPLAGGGAGMRGIR